MARVLRLMLAASVLVLLAQIYLSRSLRSAFRPNSPAAMPPTQSASVMPRVTLEDGSLCHAAPWSLAHVRAQCRAGPLRYFYAYTAVKSSWNAFQHIRRCAVAHCTCTTARTRLRLMRACARVHCKRTYCMYTPCVLIHATQPPGRRRVRGNGARRARAHRRAAADRHAQLLEAARAGLAAVAPLAGAAHQPHVGHGGGLQEGPAGADARAALRRGPLPADARVLPLARAGAAARLAPRRLQRLALDAQDDGPPRTGAAPRVE
eukprot:scaffold110706_cov72-Phaeocystis_antarctica.AAC.2